MNSKQIAALVAVLVVGGAGGFFGGIKYDQSKTMAARQQAQQRFVGGAGGQNGGRRGGQGGGGFTAGQILSKDDKSLSIQMMGGGSKIVFYSGSTQISKPAPVQASDLNNGDNVVVAGTANSDGSITAQSIQIRPAMQQPTGNSKALNQ